MIHENSRRTVLTDLPLIQDPVIAWIRRAMASLLLLLLCEGLHGSRSEYHLNCYLLWMQLYTECSAVYGWIKYAVFFVLSVFPVCICMCVCMCW